VNVTNLNECQTLQTLSLFIENLKPDIGKAGGRRFYFYTANNKLNSISFNEIVKHIDNLYQKSAKNHEDYQTTAQLIKKIKQLDYDATEILSKKGRLIQIFTSIRSWIGGFGYNRDIILKNIEDKNNTLSAPIKQEDNEKILKEEEKEKEVSIEKKGDLTKTMQCHASIHIEEFTSALILDEDKEWNTTKAPYLFKDFKTVEGEPLSLIAGDYLIKMQIFNPQNMDKKTTEFLTQKNGIYLPGSLIRKLKQGDTLTLFYQDKPLSMIIENNPPYKQDYQFDVLIYNQECRLYPRGKACSSKPVPVTELGDFTSFSTQEEYLSPGNLEKLNSDFTK
jgi:hypothetical protein